MQQRHARIGEPDVHMLPPPDGRDLRLEWKLSSGARELDVGAFHDSTFRAERTALRSSMPTRHGTNPTGTPTATRTEACRSLRSYRIRRESTLPSGRSGGEAMAQRPSKGLADVVAATTALSDIDGRIGRLSYRGYDISQLAGAAAFEEVAYLLQRGAPPSSAELAAYHTEIMAGRALGALVSADLARVAHRQEPMEALRKAARLVAQQPVLVAAYEAARNGSAVPEPDPQLSLAGNFLLQVTGRRPDERSAQILDACLVLHADHTMNASTFAARVCAATLSDMHSAVVAALG